jgi:hypothetical protein
MKNMAHLLVCALSLTLCSCVGVEAFHYDVFVFGASRYDKTAVSGEGDSRSCRLLFDPPGIYIGREVSIPTNAAVFGVVAVTDGRRCRVIPLFEWADDKGGFAFACNGPDPKFARDGKTRDELINAIVDVVKNKSAK